MNVFIESIIGTLAPERSKHYYNMLKYHKRMDDSIKEGAVIFVGDSLTQSLNATSVCNNSINFGIGSDTTFGVLKRIDQYKSIKKCRAVVLAVGVNDISRRGVDEIIDNYRKIIGKIPVKSTVIINSIFPVDSRIKRWRLNNSKVDSLNLKLEKVSKEYANCIYLDVNPYLKDDSGRLSEKFHIGDGLHLNCVGYSMWIQALNEMPFKL